MDEAASLDMASQIREAAEKARAGIREGLPHALEAGQLLLRVKAAVGPEWPAWLAQHVPEMASVDACKFMELVREVNRANFSA